MAVKDVVSGAKIEDTEDVFSNWIRIADVNGKGFSEAYPKATSYDHNNLKFDSKGNARAYLKGDIVKVQVIGMILIALFSCVLLPTSQETLLLIKCF